MCSEVAQQSQHSERRQAERHARLILDGMYQFVGLVDLNGNLVEVNRTAMVEGGVRPDQFVNKPIWESPWFQVSPEVVDICRRDIGQALAGKFVRHELEVYGAEAGSETITVDFSLSPIHDEKDKLWIVAEGRNITAKKKAEAEVARKTEELQQAHERLKEFDKLKSDFFANVSHELRTPLTLIQGRVRQLLGSKDLNTKARESLETVDRNAGILLKQVNNILDLAKMETQELKLHYVASDLARLVRLVASYFEVFANEHQIHFEVKTPEMLAADFDADKIQRVILNLLSNAFKFCPHGGRVRCQLFERNGRAVLQVEDSGPGVPNHLRQAIFERFRQIEGHRNRKKGGSGLGLSITKEFINLHQGQIEVTDSEWEGALFLAEIPLSAPPDTSVENSSEPWDIEKSVSSSIDELNSYEAPPLREISSEGETVDPRPTVLVVEDNPDMNIFLVESLNERYRVESAYNGEEGFRKARKFCPDLIITDIMMPEVSGDQMIERMAKDLDLNETPVLVLTAKAEDEQRVQLLREGAQDHLLKPFNVNELLARADGLIKRRRDTIRRLKELNIQLNDKAIELAQTADELRQHNEDLEQIVRITAHDLKEPVRLILCYLELLMQGMQSKLGENEKDYVEVITKSSQRMYRLIDDIMSYSQIASSSQPEMQLVNLNQTLEEVREDLKLQIKEASARIHAQALPSVEVNPTHLRQVFQNLISNALKFRSEQELEITIEALERESEWCIAVRDNGIGIKPENFKKIFDLFQQLVRKSGEGTGVGLCICKRLVGMHGGKIWVESEINQGSSFYFTLPKHTRRQLPSSSPSDT